MRDTNFLNSAADSSQKSELSSACHGQSSGYRSRSRPELWDVR